ncbi:hypothetical protein ABH977_000836 [Bradyrhizobium ottawaense]
MGGFARGLVVVEIVALVKERRLRRIQVLCRNVLLQRAPAESDDAAAQIGDREHHAIAEAVVRHGNVVAGHQQAGLDHVVDGNAELAEVLLQREAIGRGIAEAELQLRRRRDRAVGEIAARLGADARGQGLREIGRGEIHDVMQRPAALLLPRRIRRHRRQRQARHAGEPLDGFREGQAVGLHHEADDVAVLARGEVVVKTLLVVDVEGRRLLLLERRQPLPLPPRLLQLDALAHDFGDRKPGTKLVEELGCEAHYADFWAESGVMANRIGI